MTRAIVEGETVSPVPSGGPPRPVRPRPWRRTGALIKGLPVRTLDQLARSCNERLGRQLAELSLWDPSDHGRTWVASDTNLVIVSFNVSPEVESYVQFASTPVERTVLCEVASAQYQPGLQHLLTNDRTESLLARGFSLGKRPSNFRREVVIDGPDAARRIASETLEILFHVFGYRGPQPLSCSFVADRVASPGPAHTRLTARQLALTLRSLGFLVLAVEEGPGEAHRVRAQSEALIFDADLNGPVGTSWYRMQLVLSCRFVPHANATLETANAFNAACGPARAIVNPGRSLRLEFVVPLHMGITEDYLRSALRGFADNMHELDFLVSSRCFEPELADALPN